MSFMCLPDKVALSLSHGGGGSLFPGSYSHSSSAVQYMLLCK